MEAKKIGPMPRPSLRGGHLRRSSDLTVADVTVTSQVESRPHAACG